MLRASVDFPTPFGPTRTTLVASLRKSSEIRASKAERSQRLGQFQSNSQIGLKRPIRASRRRRSRLRRARSCSSQSIRVCTQLSVATCVQCASRPLRLSSLARACKASRSFIGWLLELVIGFEAVRGDGCVARLDVGRQIDGDGRPGLSLFAAMFERQAYRIGMRHTACEGFSDGGLQFGGAIAVEQPQQRGRDRSKIVAALSRTDEQVLTCRCGLCETVGAAMIARSSLVGYERVDMRGVLDLGALVVAAGVTAKYFKSIDDAYFVRVGQQRRPIYACAPCPANRRRSTGDTSAISRSVARVGH